MKKMMIIISGLFLCFGVLTGCGENLDMSTYEQRLRDLENQLMEMEAEIANSELLINEYEERINVLEANRSTTKAKLSQAEARITTLEELALDEVKLFVANEYYLIPGETFQLFYRSIIQAVNPYRYYIKLTGTVGHGYNRYYEWTPESSHNNRSFALKIEVCNDLGEVLSAASTTLKVNSVSSGTSKRILCIGDSLTSNGYWVSHGFNQYRNAGGANHTFLGTITGGYQITLNYEGRGGWQWSSYVSGYDATTPSPFKALNGTGISFIDYCTKNGYTGIDELYILMTWNGIGGSFRTFGMNSEPFLSAKKFIDQFHLDYPAARVTLLGIPQPSIASGLGAYYTINSSYGDNYGQFVSALNYNRQLESFSQMAAYSSFMRYIDVKAQFDCEYNMPTTTKAVNTESTTTEIVGSAASMGMHPTTAGYLQIGDVFYRVLAQG